MKNLIHHLKLARNIRFVYDGWNVVEERRVRNGSAGVVVRNFVWGEDLSGSFQGAGGVGGLVAHMEKPDSAGWTAYYYHPDANGNIAAVTSPFRALAAKFSYDAFGRTTSQSGPKSGIDLHALNYRFSTKPMELELATSNTTLVPPPVSSGLYYYGYRFYSPNLGRWISRDPIREQGGRNLYNFVGNDSVNWIDILGLARTIITTTCGKNYDKLNASQADTMKFIRELPKCCKVITFEIRGHGHPRGIETKEGDDPETIEVSDDIEPDGSRLQIVRFSSDKTSLSSLLKDRTNSSTKICFLGCNTANEGKVFGSKDNISKLTSEQIQDTSVSGYMGFGLGNIFYKVGTVSKTVGIIKTYRNGK